jgi:hypothetical protein
MKKKLVSLIIPSYKPLFFEQALKSAIGQTYENLQIYVSDNCPDNSIKEICENYTFVKYFRNHEMGFKNITSALYASQGDYIKVLFDDDLLHPFCVERMVKAIERSDCAVVFSSSQVINGNNDVVELRRPIESDVLLRHEQLARAVILNFNNFIGEFSSVLINKKYLQKIRSEQLALFGSFDFTKGLSDIATFLNLTKNNNAYYIDEVLTYFRKDQNINSNSVIDAERNPNFKYAITEWVDLLIQGHLVGIITDDEIKSKASVVHNFLNYFKNSYPEVLNYEEVYLAYIKKI